VDGHRMVGSLNQGHPAETYADAQAESWFAACFRPRPSLFTYGNRQCGLVFQVEGPLAGAQLRGVGRRGAPDPWDTRFAPPNVRKGSSFQKTSYAHHDRRTAIFPRQSTISQ
jgi:hypothetical protein